MSKNILPGLKKESNNVFVKFECAICISLFEAGEEVFALKDGSHDLVCYQCAEGPKGETEKRIRARISYLEEGLEFLLTVK